MLALFCLLARSLEKFSHYSARSLAHWKIFALFCSLARSMEKITFFNTKNFKPKFFFDQMNFWPQNSFDRMIPKCLSVSMFKVVCSHWSHRSLWWVNSNNHVNPNLSLRLLFFYILNKTNICLSYSATNKPRKNPHLEQNSRWVHLSHDHLPCPQFVDQLLPDPSHYHQARPGPQHH